jgi:NAD(P)-dependent dehydrogenase (short-subunit alcohol dehydrogenase family)
MSVYAATKAAVNALVLSLTEETAGDPIGINVLLPSIIDTPANRSAMPDAERQQWVTVDELFTSLYPLCDPGTEIKRGQLIQMKAKRES